MAGKIGFDFSSKNSWLSQRIHRLGSFPDSLAVLIDYGIRCFTGSLANDPMESGNLTDNTGSSDLYRPLADLNSFVLPSGLRLWGWYSSSFRIGHSPRLDAPLGSALNEGLAI